VYVGDVWKVNRQLTLNYGLRYQYDSVPYESAGAEAVPSIGFDSYMATRVAQSAASKNGNTSLPFITYNLGGKVNNGPNYYDPNVKTLLLALPLPTTRPLSRRWLSMAGGHRVRPHGCERNPIHPKPGQLPVQNSVATNYGDPSSPSNSLKNDPRYGTNFGFPAAPVAPAIGKPYTPYVSSTGVPQGLANQLSNNAVDLHLHDPYSIAMNAGIQQELPARFVMKLNYVGRLGRRLLGQADGSQLIDYVDPVSGQALSQAYAAVTTQLRAGVTAANVTAQPWF